MNKDKRLFFVCYPDTNNPIGGVKQIYRQVEILAKSGWNAWVMQQEQGFRANWFESEAPVIDLTSYIGIEPNPSTDLIILPETWLTTMPEYFPKIPKVIFNQNAFYSFGLAGKCDNQTLALYQHEDIKAVVTVSNDSKQLLVRGIGIPEEKCKVILNGIDPKLFYMPNVKVRSITFLGRKQADHARKIAVMAQNRPSLQHYKFQELPKLTHSEIASELRETLVYMSCGHPEGFGLPLAEAIACGCLTVGYHGLGGRDFALPFMKNVDFGDLLGFLNLLEESIISFEKDPQIGMQKLLANSKSIQKQYSPEQEQKRCLEVWDQITSL